MTEHSLPEGALATEGSRAKTREILQSPRLLQDDLTVFDPFFERY